MSVRDGIKTAIINKLKTIKTSVGYGTDVSKVYGADSDSFEDNIPMGLDLEEFNLPAILVITGDDKPEMKQGCLYGHWHYELQLWHNDVSDEKMNVFVRDVYKCLFAGSSAAQRKNAFRSLHPNLHDITPAPIGSDLNMIDGNRCYIANFIIEYATQLWDM